MVDSALTSSAAGHAHDARAVGYGTEVPVAGVNGWRCWGRGIALPWEAAMPEQYDPAAARETIKALRIHPSPTDLRYQSALQRYISALSPARGTEEQAMHSTWLWNADHSDSSGYMMTTNVVTRRARARR
jgi:hypothetical protein